MHLLTEQTVTIRCAVERAFAYATNLEHFGEWFPGVLSIVSANTLPHAEVGKEYLETVEVPGRGEQRIVIRVRESKRDSFFATEGEFPPLMPRMELAFEPQGVESCRITWRMFSRNDNEQVRLTVLPMAMQIMTPRAERGVLMLKERLEPR